MSFNDRKFVIFNVIELNLIDFTQVLEASMDTVRLSVDGTKTFVKWEESKEPSFLKDLTTMEGPYDYETMLTILETPEWCDINNPFV